MKNFFATLTAAAALMAFADGAHAGPTHQTLFYTTDAGGSSSGTGPNVWTVDVNYTGSGTAGNGTFTLNNDTAVATLPGADGIVANPNNSQLLVGGQAAHSVFQLDPVTKTFKTVDTGHNVYELTVDPSQNVVWAGASENGHSMMISSVPIKPFAGPATSLTVSGSNTEVTHITFVSTGGTVKAYYTSDNSAPSNSGNGDFGTIDLTTGKTTAILTHVLAAHGMIFDPFSGDLILGGGNQIVQIDPTTNTIVSTLTLSVPAGEQLDQLDQGTVDGQGHLFWADTFGRFLFVDYSQTGKVGNTGNFVSNSVFKGALDDIAPLIGNGGTNEIPEPTTLALFATGFAGLALARRRNKA